MLRVLIFCFFLSSYVWGKEIVFNQEVKFNIDILYPDKEIFYVKEPLKIVFKITSDKGEALKYLKIQPMIGKNVFIQRKKSIEKNILKETFVLFFLREGKSLLPFKISYQSDVFSGEKSISSDRTFLIVPIPKDISYVGDFFISGKFEGKNGVGTYTLRIKGKGFPFLPKHTLIVKNGSGKKIRYIIDRNMEYVYQEEKFKIVYLDSLKIKPVKFTFFNPYLKKVITVETEEITLSKEKTPEEPWRKLSEIEKEKFYIQKFKNLYPELFEKKSVIDEAVLLAYNLRYHLLSFFLILFAVVTALLVRLSRKYLPEDVYVLLKLDMGKEEDIKRLYKYLSTSDYSFRHLKNQIERQLYKKEPVKKEIFLSIIDEIFIQKTRYETGFRKLLLKVLFFVYKNRVKIFLIFAVIFILTVVMLVWK
jgi:hypothetical protein